jgi:hypothetical protein
MISYIIPYIQTAMPIRGFLSGQAFEPEVVRQMSLALETICGKFGMTLADEPITRVVATKIIASWRNVACVTRRP